jgi:tRNA(Arg) A34 adenosine deaminase TadA
VYQDSLAVKEYGSEEEMMKVAIHISAQNVATGDGGPFGCAIFERNKATGKSRVFSVGANRVVPLLNSTLHGETVAIQFAQKKLQCFSLRQEESSEVEYVLCTSCEPCAMCLGATFWSGVAEIICAATKNDAEAIGFDEGPVFEASYEKLEEAGIKVTRNVLRDEGAKVLCDYGQSGHIYN